MVPSEFKPRTVGPIASRDADYAAPVAITDIQLCLLNGISAIGALSGLVNAYDDFTVRCTVLLFIYFVGSADYAAFPLQPAVPSCLIRLGGILL